MKKSLTTFVISLLFMFNCNAQSTWQTINSPVTEDLISLSFTDETHGWILSEEGTLLKTTDGGDSWQTSNVGSGRFTSIYFTSQTHGCITATLDSSLIFLTNDGGDTWQEIDHPHAQRLNDVYFANDLIGWTVGIAEDMNFNLYTSDGGLTWSPQMDIFIMEAELFSVSFRDEEIGTTCGADGNFFVTNSGGVSGWAKDISIPSLGIDLFDVVNWGDLKGCAVGTMGTALYTANTWAQYTETNTNTSETLNAVAVDPLTNKLWAVGENGTIIYTSNYLLGWGIQNSGVTTDLYDIDMLSENNGWAIGDHGTILHFTEGSSVGEDTFPGITIYPNPTKGLIYLEMKNQQDTQVSLLDMTGKMLLTKNITDHLSHIEIDTSPFPAGIYFLRINTAEKTIVKKIHRY